MLCIEKYRKNIFCMMIILIIFYYSTDKINMTFKLILVECCHMNIRRLVRTELFQANTNAISSTSFIYVTIYLKLRVT